VTIWLPPMANVICRPPGGKGFLAAGLCVGALAIAATGLIRASPAADDPAAEFVQLTVNIETLSWKGGSGPGEGSKTESYQFHLVVGRNKWVLEDTRDARTVCSFDGDRTRERIWIRDAQSPQGAVGDPSSGHWWTPSDRLSDGNPSRTARSSDFLYPAARYAWLAFCSGPTLNNRNHKLYPPHDLWKEMIAASTITEKVTRFEDDLGLPRTASLFYDGRQRLLDYSVTTTTNFAGWNFPVGFFLLDYSLPQSATWGIQWLAHGTLQSVSLAADPMPPSPKPASAVVAGTRFVPVAPSRISVGGSSDVHDWSLENTNVIGFLELDRPLPDVASGQSRGVVGDRIKARAEFSVPIRHFGTEFYGPMFSAYADQAFLHKVFKTTDYPNILYRLRELQPVAIQDPKGRGYSCESTGELVVGNVSYPISMPVTLTPEGDTLRVSGLASLKLSDLGVTPPMAQGNDWLVKVGDTIRPSFDLVLRKAQDR